MAHRIEDILNNCLERIFRGESIEDCLASYPEEASELEPLLNTGLSITQKSAAIKPSPEFKAGVSAQLQAMLHAREEEMTKMVKVPLWRMRWVRAMASVLIVFFAGIGMMAASANALPDETLYPLKLAVEQARVPLAFSDISEAKLHLQFAEERVDEIAEMAREGKSEQIPGLVERFSSHLERAVGSAQGKSRVWENDLLAPSGEGGKYSAADESVTDMSNAIAESSERSSEILQDALEETPGKSKYVLQQTQEDIMEEYQDALVQIRGRSGSINEKAVS